MRNGSRDDGLAPLVAIVAMTPDGVIGRDGDMPWRLSSDLKRFKKLTMGGTLIMGRKTYDSIGRPLPGRRTIVVTRNVEWSADGVDRADSPHLAVKMARAVEAARTGGDEQATAAQAVPFSHAVAAAESRSKIFVVGGAEIYRQLLEECDEVWLTRVWSRVEGDTRLDLDLGSYGVREMMRIPASKNNDVPTDFVRLGRQVEN